MASFLMAIEFGPVQEFIVAGRKTRDLWLGSTLLSRTAGVVAKSLVADWNALLIFPAIDNADDIKPGDSFPDKLLAKLDSDTPAVIAEKLEAAARKHLFDALDVVLERLDPSDVHKDFARHQVEQFLDFYVAWVPLISDADYPAQRERVEQLLMARTMIRDFERAPDLATFPGSSFPEAIANEQTKAGVAKSSLDPGRETVLRANGRPASAHNKLEEKARSRLRIKAGEQLDGMSLLKRLGDIQRFVSVSRVTIDPFIRRLACDRPDALARLVDMAKEMADAGHPAVDRLKLANQPDLAHFAAFPYDTQLFFDPSASDEELDDAHKGSAQAFFDAIQDARRDLKIGELTNKVAIITADGDRVGAALDRRRTIRAHREFDARIANYAIEARAIVAKHQGAAIYTGGDDLLAMVPLDRALACADELRLEFEKLNEGEGEHTPPVSLSVGIAVGHYTTHLQSLLRWSRKALNVLAKEQGGRNALAVTIHTGNSQENALEVIQSWAVNPVETRWETWVTWYQRGAISRGVAYELRDLAVGYRELIKEDASIGTTLTNRTYADPDEARHRARPVNSSLLELEVLHLLTSKRPDTEATMDPADVAALMAALGNSLEGLEQLADELIAALHFAEAFANADGADRVVAEGNQP
jgi:CRISPR-associated protein Cmr2